MHVSQARFSAPPYCCSRLLWLDLDLTLLDAAYGERMLASTAKQQTMMHCVNSVQSMWNARPPASLSPAPRCPLSAPPSPLPSPSQVPLVSPSGPSHLPLSSVSSPSHTRSLPRSLARSYLPPSLPPSLPHSLTPSLTASLPFPAPSTSYS